MKIALLMALVASQFALASGWDCEEISNGYPRVKIRNHTDKTRTPAVMVVSRRGGTILTGKDEEISKKNLSNGVRYTTSDESWEAILFVKHKEGSDKPLKNGDTVSGKLILIEDQDSSTKDTFDVECARYLKSE